MTEKEFTQAVRDLAWHCGWLEYHTYRSTRSTPGFPDLCMVRGDRLIFVELKVGRNKPTADQLKWTGALGKVPNVEVYIWFPEDLEFIARCLSRGYQPQPQPVYLIDHRYDTKEEM